MDISPVLARLNGIIETDKQKELPMPSVDFASLKERTCIEDVARQLLNLELFPEGKRLRTKDRKIVITPEKQVFYSFADGKGGDSISLVSLHHGCSVKEAAEAIARHFGGNSSPKGAPHSSSPRDGTRPAFDAGRYASKLDPEHETLASLNIGAETLKEWKAGYASDGINRGRLALPIAHLDGAVVAYIGRTLKDEQPVFTCPKDFDPAAYLFGADRVGEGEITVVRDVLDVLRASENGVDNCVAFLTETISILQLEVLIATMHEKGATALQLF
jgi:DNA primase